MNPSKNYIALTEGRMTKTEFLRQARQSFPNLIGAGNSFDDALKILTRKGLINEEIIYQNKADKFPLEAIERGIRYELEVMDVYDIHHPSQEQYKKARQRAIDNLSKDPLYYVNKIGENVEQPKQEETEGDLKKVEAGSKHTLKEGRYTGVDESDLSMHKDVNMNADLGGGEEAPAKKAQSRTKYKEDHDWTVNDYKIAFILAEYGKQGLTQVFSKYGSQISNASLKLLANTIIGTTDAGLQFAIQGMKKVITGVQDGEWLQSYFHNSNALQAYQELNGKSLEECIGALSTETCSEEEATAAKSAQEQIDINHRDKDKQMSAATREIVKKAADDYKQNRGHLHKAISDPVKADKATFLNTCKHLGYEIDDPRRAVLWSYLRSEVAMNGEAMRQLDAKLGVNEKNLSVWKSKNLKEQNIEEAPLEDNPQLNKKFLDLYIKYKDGNYQVKDKETGELKPGKKLAPETAAQKACLVVRKSMNAPRFRPDRNTIASCSVGRGKLQYQGERDGVPTFNYAWSLKEEDVDEAQYGEISKDPIYTQLYQHYLKKAKDAKDVNAEKTARKQAKASYLKYKEKHSMQENKKSPNIDALVLKETLVQMIGKVLEEAATANLAALSDENASVAELPGIINSLENVVTEIESFWIKEQQKIQGIFDQVGNIKNEDGLPVGYKFVQPILESLKKDLEPVLAKITLDDLKLPEAPAPDQTQVNDPNAEVDPNAVPPIPEKKTVFSPAAKASLQESKRRYTK